MTMLQISSFAGRSTPILASALLLFALGGCSVFEGDDGDPGPAGPTGEQGDPGPSYGPTTSITITVDSVTIGAPPKPVVELTVKNQDGNPFAGLAEGDLRFNLAKLTAEMNGNPSFWQNYITRTRGSGISTEGSQERVSTNTAYRWGTWVNNLDGTYTYTFNTDLNSAQSLCAGPCTDADGNPLDLSYEPGKTHRLGIQLGNAEFGRNNTTYDFVPTGAAVTAMRDIVKTANCNECHNTLRIHGSRVETKFCVTCHNPGSWVAGTPNTTVDFKVYIHKIHRGADLAQQPYTIGSDDFSDVHFPQDIRNCTKCHTDSDSDANRNTPQGGNWSTKPSVEACGSCHDAYYFGAAPDPDRPWQTTPHPGGVPVTNQTCTFCHSATGPAGTVASKHIIPRQQNAENYQFVIDAIRGNGQTSSPFLEIDISVKNPNTGALYDIASGDATTNPVFKASNARLALDIGWSTIDSGANVDYVNFVPTVTPATGYTVVTAPTPAQPLGVNPVAECAFHVESLGTDPDPDWVCSDPEGDFVFTLTKQSALPAGAVGTGRVGFEGHPAQPDNSDRMQIKSVVKDFAITDMTPIARRDIVDIAKCNKCHQQLSLHGGNRTDEPQLCVMCHNPSLTDISYNNNSNFACAGPTFPDNRARPKVTTDGTIDGFVLYPLTSCLDGQTEQNAQFKVLIHSIHAAGFRTKGVFQVRRDDFGHVRFPGILSDCETCHLEGTYELEGAWEAPTLNGLQSASIATTPAANLNPPNPPNTSPVVYGDALNDQADDLRTSPTAAACAACHDSATVQAHMTDLGGATFGATQAAINNTFETCSVCHGPGSIADVEAVHEAATAARR